MSTCFNHSIATQRWASSVVEMSDLWFGEIVQVNLLRILGQRLVFGPLDGSGGWEEMDKVPAELKIQLV